jgi:hypothetical protein
MYFAEKNTEIVGKLMSLKKRLCKLWESIAFREHKY